MKAKIELAIENANGRRKNTIIEIDFLQRLLEYQYNEINNLEEIQDNKHLT